MLTERIRHYKDRFKRQQGAHLYLPGSYVTEGGEGPDSGPWSDWSEPSPCSRTCGGGVSTQYRTCQEGYACQGPDKRHFSCNTQDCPDTADFRSQQCSQYDEIPFETVKYQWVPYTKAPNPCELNCMPRGERFYYRHASKVVDGTRCNDESIDVCVNGKCQPVGCDMMLGSSAREDECRVCGGDGSTCNTIEHTIEMKDMQVGYNDILLIPAGATNILVEEVAPTNNYLAVRNTSGYYYLNGNWRVDFPRTMDFAGTKFHYERYPQGFSAPDKLTALGPIDEPIFIVLLFQEASDVPVRYRYSLPTNVQPGSESETYAWTFDQFTPCSTTCGGGIQYRNVTCAGRKTLQPVEQKLCDSNSEPESSRKCSEIPCEAQWVPHPWGNCSAPCGEGGVQIREISCQQIVSNGYPTLVDESQCFARGNKPPQQQKCNEGKTCANWYTGPWKPCDHLCGPGKQTRQIKCYIKNEKGKIQILNDAECERIEPKPDSEKKCNLRPCEGVDWITSEWSGCGQICGLTNETRKVFCATADGQIHDDKLCEEDHEKPETVRNCETSNATCEYLWYSSQWSDCSATCGEGVQTRTLFCGVVTSEGVKKVENNKCDLSKNFDTLKKCKGEKECEGEWFSGPWGECSKPCGGGERTKKVVCLKGNEVVEPSHCDSSKIIFSQEDCNQQPCTADSILPTDVTKSVDESEPTKPKETLTTAEPTSEQPPTSTEEAVTSEQPTSTTESAEASSTTESEISTTTSEQRETSESSSIGSSESSTMSSSEETKEVDSSPSETELTEVFEVSTEPGAPPPENLEDDEYEIVPSDTCEDGEWVDVGVVGKEKDDIKSSATELASTTEPASGSSFSLDDLMLSDGTTIEGSDTEITGSGDDETSPSALSTESSASSTESSASSTDSTDEEGSGSEPSTIISDDYATETVYKSSVSGETEAGTSPSHTEVTTDSSGGSTSSEESSSILSLDSSTIDSSSESSVSTASALTEESGSTDISASTVDASSSIDVSSSTESSSSTEVSGSTEISPSTELSSASTDLSGSTETSVSSEFSSSSTSESSISTETTETVTTESTEATITISSTSDGFTSSSEGSTTEEGSSSSTTEESSSGSTTEESSSGSTTEGSLSTSIGSTESTESSTVFSEASSVASTEPEEVFVGEVEVGKKTTTVISTEAESTSEVTRFTEGTSTEISGSTAESSAGTTEISGASTESSTDFTGSTVSTEGETPSTTEFSGSSEATTEFTGSTESNTELSSSTTEVSTTEMSGSTEFDIFGSTTESTEESSSEYGTTPITDIFKPKKVRMCKRRKVKSCKKTKFGCCWDHITPAKGPFDKGCPTPKTCKESKYGCCEDGVSAALGPKFRGCPPTHCEETLFGCCEDGRTPAEGENSEGCPPPPPACLKSKYGCCKDNVTEAKGPKHKGCEPEEVEGATAEPIEDCSNSTYGCCPDGISLVTGEYFEGCDIFKDNCTESYYGCCPDGKTSAKGPDSRGCELLCASSTFGCCPDKVTPAHGPSGEGCCLAGPFGCCPDNITPARGINLEGCGCQYSPYGCCPDNKTSARGYENAGCGCQYTEHGCCPDDYTRAHGPNYGGCLCHTFQFGCCPDGVSVAKGPHQQGCGCRNSEFGCCSDEETPASGPSMAGCGCEASKYGCCLDGIAEAKGENFEGCDEIPANLQDSCSLPKERGTCKNYTVKWFYDMDYGGCSRFWYGGCEGNDNRYRSKEECDQICVEPQGEDRCKLPKVAGPCAGYYPQWYYDKAAKHCTQFVYGGCLGNNNRFETREECMQLCVKDDTVDACEQPKEEGPCRGQNRRYFFNKASGQCDEFAYGGCKGNNNNFRSVEACNQKCATPGRKKDHCTLPRAQGNCTEKVPSWYYDTPEKRCLPFYYSGCNGNQNNFPAKEACEADCPPEIVKDTCHLPAETGECGNYVDRWYFDTKEKACRQFYYGGCGGNDNNFQTQEQCHNSCEQPKEPKEEVQQPEPQQPERAQPQPSEPSATAVVPSTTEMCFYPADGGPCRDNVTTKYYYDSSDGVCKSFTYGGCGGNTNNFNSLEECLQYCGGSQDICTLPPVVGPCSAEYVQYYYNPATDSCQTFIFGGCEGNYNRFHDQASCEQRCRRVIPSQPIGTQAPPVWPSDVAMCYEPPAPGNCTESYSAYFFDKDTGTCTTFTYTGCGGNGNRFNTEEQCERQCGAFRGQDVCSQERDTGPCRGYFPKYYYDKAAGRCGQFVYGGCQGNGNRFSSNEECERICLTHEEAKPNITSTAICLLAADPGPCPEAYLRRWYFDNMRGECIAFIYSGCGGNLNNFKTFQACLDYCKDLLPQTEQPPPPEPSASPAHECQAVFDECTTMRCQYGVEAFIDENDCNRCQCHDPCKAVDCPEHMKCGIDLNFNKTSITDADFIAVCREHTKAGECPNLEQSLTNCDTECRSDADCTRSLKCCSTGCGTACVEAARPPAELVTQQPYLPTYTDKPMDFNPPQPPKIDVIVYEPEVSASLGDQVILNCAVTGNPNPKISWSKDNLLIDGTQPRFRIKLDQTLQIITLHKTDAGIYLCTAENNVGEPLTNQIKLDVLDSEPRPATILEPEDQLLSNQIASLNSPLTLNCYVLGWPFPAVTWWKDDSMIPLKNNEFEVKKDYSLLIHSVQLHNLGIYTCQAYNGVGKAASWAVTVRAKGPYYSTDPKDTKYLQFIVNPPGSPSTTLGPALVASEPPHWPYRPNLVNRPTPQPYIPPVYSTEPSPEIEDNEILPLPPAEGLVPEPVYTVPVKANITTNERRYSTGSDIQLPCHVMGFPIPQVQWYKDGIPIYPSGRISITDIHTLTIRQAEKSDSGTYQCEATNQYTRASSSLEISVEGMYIHPSCTDNQFFANCALIVEAKYCTHKYYAKFCCRSCTEAGLLPVDGPHIQAQISKQNAIDNNII